MYYLSLFICIYAYMHICICICICICIPHDSRPSAAPMHARANLRAFRRKAVTFCGKRGVLQWGTTCLTLLLSNAGYGE